MAKNVQMPDGSVIAFPDEMDDATIHSEGLKYLQNKQQEAFKSGLPAGFGHKTTISIPLTDKINTYNDPNVGPRLSVTTKDKVLGKIQLPYGVSMMGASNQGTNYDPALEASRYILPPAAAAAAGSAAAPVTGGLGSFAAGTAAYTALDTLLKRLKSGDKVPLGEDLLSSAGEGLLNETGGRVIGKGISTVKAFNKLGTPDPSSILNLKPTASQALASTGDHSIATSIMKFLEDHFASGSKAAAQTESARLGSEKGFKIAAKEAGRSVSTIKDPNAMFGLIETGLVPESSVGPVTIKPKPVSRSSPVSGQYEVIPGVVKEVPFATDPASLDKLFRDPVKLQDALTKGQAAGVGYNVRQDMAGYQLSRIQEAATSRAADGSIRIDPVKIQNALYDPEMIASNKILFKGSNGLSNAQQFYKNLAYTQDKPGTSRILRYANTIGIPMSLIHSAISGNVAGAAAAGSLVGVELSAAALAKALTNPQSARLMLAMANKDALGVSEQYAARMIVKAISGSVINLVNQDGSKTPAKVGFGGELKPLD